MPIPRKEADIKSTERPSGHHSLNGLEGHGKASAFANFTDRKSAKLELSVAMKSRHYLARCVLLAV
jgi:hypothetical protein